MKLYSQVVRDHKRLLAHASNNKVRWFSNERRWLHRTHVEIYLTLKHILNHFKTL
jgi:hypothetical protein